MNRPSPTPRRPERSGSAGESVAAAWLAARGYRIEARNLRTVHGEIDLLARRRRRWVAVEVKARQDHPAPERLVDGERLDRMARALAALAPSLRPRPRSLQLDVVAIRWRDAAPAEVSHFPALRRLAVADRDQPPAIGDWRPPEAAGYAWPMAARLAARCRLHAARCARLLRRLLGAGRRRPKADS